MEDSRIAKCDPNHVSKMLVKYGGHLDKNLCNYTPTFTQATNSTRSSSLHDLDLGYQPSDPKSSQNRFSASARHSLSGPPGFAEKSRKFRCTLSRGMRIAVGAALISFGVTILIIGILVYHLKDVDIGSSVMVQNSTREFEVYVLENDENWFGGDRRYNASVGSVFMACGGLAIILGISLLVIPFINPTVTQVPTLSRKKLSSVVFFNRKDIEAVRKNFEKRNSSKISEEPKVSHF